MNDKINILGVEVDRIDPAGVKGRLGEWLDGDRFRYLVTPNPEIILAALRDEALYYILNHADLAIPDGFGLVIAAWLSGRSLARLPGADLIDDLLVTAAAGGRKVAIVSWPGALSRPDEIISTLRDRYPGITVKVFEIDRAVGVAPAELTVFAPDLVLVNFGSPYQEKFIYGGLRPIAGIKLAIGIGGGLDFLTGRMKRAPVCLRQFGLEWIWRLALEPWRFRRIWNATAVFTFRFLKWRYWNPWFYRKNVVCLLYRRINGRIDVMTVKRLGQDHWQLPQGGTDGEPIERAGRRELTDELNIRTGDIRPVKTYPKLFHYDIDKEQEKHDNSSRDRGYRGQAQSLFIGEFTGNDALIRLNFWELDAWRWVPLDRLIDSLHPIRREAGRIFVERLKRTINQ